MLKNIFHTLKTKGGNGEKRSLLYTAAEAFETFFYVPNKVTTNGVHIRDKMDMKRTMIVVVIALIPCLLFGMWNVGYQHFLSNHQSADFWQVFFYGFLKVFPLVVVSYVVGLGIEFLFSAWHRKEVSEGFLVSGLLIPLICPPDIPLWMVALATAFSVVIGKEVFGGTGMNVWNPALIARAFLYFAYPAQISGDKIWIAGMPDGFSGATPLGNVLNGAVEKLPSINEMIFGTIPGCIGETSKICILIGAIILIWTGVGSARIMISAMVGALATALLCQFILPVNHIYAQVTPLDHILLGGFLFGVVFMATDPVTAAQTANGKLVYGFLIGFFAIVIRVFNPAYPEGIMLAILLMNTFAPLIDHVVVSRNIQRRLKRLKPVQIK